MARSVVAVAKLLEYNKGYASVADAIDLTNDHEIDASDAKCDSLLIVIENATTEVGTATLVAGGFYSGSSEGDLEIAIGDSTTVAVAIESARFKDSAGKINLDMASTGSLTGKISATELP